MSIGSTVNRNDYVGNASTATYNYSYKIISSSDLLVTQKDATTGVETTHTLTTDYTVTGVGNANGGTITLVAGNLPSGDALTIRRVRPLTQSTDIRNQGSFYPESHEDAFDHAVMIAQQQENDISRSLKLSETDVSGIDVTLPVTHAAGEALTVNATGDGFIYAAISAVPGSALAATQAEAEAGTNNTAYMTPLRAEQHHDNRSRSLGALSTTSTWVNSTITGNYWLRDGFLKGMVKVAMTGAGSGDFKLNLPGSYTISGLAGTDVQHLGSFDLYDAGSTQRYSGLMMYESTTQLKGFFYDSKTSIVTGADNGNTGLTANVTPIDFTEVSDTAGQWDGNTFTADEDGNYFFVGIVGFTASVAGRIDAYVDTGGGFTRTATLHENVTQNSKPFSAVINLSSGDAVELRSSGAATLTTGTDNHRIAIYRLLDQPKLSEVTATNPITVANTDLFYIQYEVPV